MLHKNLARSAPLFFLWRGALIFLSLININFVFSEYKNLDPKVAAFVNNLAKKGGPPIYKLPIEKARKVLDDLQEKSVGTIPASIQDIKISGDSTKKEPGTDVSVRIVRPIGSKQILPAIIFLHGGGWILGNKNTHDRLIREIANGVNATVVFVNYTPSPEAQYPTAIEQAYSALKYIAENAKKLNINPNKIAVVGDSVGGNMAIALTLLTKERKGPKLSYQVLFYPVTDANFNTPSYNQFAQGPWLTKAAMQWFWDAYLPNKSQRTNATASPLQATINQLKGLPPTLIIVDENDVLRDEGEAFAHKLMQAGVNVTAVRYLGTIHDFVMLAPISDTAATRSAIELAIAMLKKVFE